MTVTRRTANVALTPTPGAAMAAKTRPTLRGYAQALELRAP
ncbi:hypothetical protein J2X16_004061 [Pelomonas aquatica]|uniref:Uncharacterized protein n=1 Tax=Pelomonas aquatica TaxID=431058 RepID=A0ABU1ZDQ2_9BURK|nr:hypothetical protein [Pelomonas aquatica]